MSRQIGDAFGWRPGEEGATREALDLLESIVETVRQPLVVLSADLRVISANDWFYEDFGLAPERVEGRSIYELGNHAWDTPRLRELLEEILPARITVNNFEMDHNLGEIGPRRLVLNARRLRREGGDDIMLVAIKDMTELGRAKEALREAESELEIRRRIADLLIARSDEQTYAEVLEVIMETFKTKHHASDLSKDLKFWGQCPPLERAKRAEDPLQKDGRHST